MLRRLPQYLQQKRKRAGLSQADVAYLLGVRASTKVSRYERSRHLPPLQTALAYELLFGTPIAELFPGPLLTIRRNLQRRARRRVTLLARQPQKPRLVRRQRSIERLFA